MKGRLPQHVLFSKAKQLYEEYCVLTAEAGEEPEKLKLTRKWLQKWCKDYRISLKYPRKRFSITQEVRKRRIIQILKNVWTAKYWWKAKYNVDHPILSADQMPLHRNVSGSQKSFNFSGSDQSCFVKENHHLSRERSTVMTLASSSNASRTPPLEFVFKGKGIRVKFNPLERATAQSSDKGSYGVEHVLKYTESLPTIPIHFALEKRRVFSLADYSARLVPEVEEAFFKKGYFFIFIGG